MGSRATSPFLRAKILVGSYTGNGVDNRNIDVGIDLSSKGDVFVFVHSTTTAWTPLVRMEMGQGDLSKPTGAFAELADRIQSITSTGFQVGINQRINENIRVFRYIVIWSEP